MEGIPQATSFRFAVRKLQRELAAAGIEYLDLSGSPYDAGMAVDVVEIASAPENTNGERYVIERMVTPVILWQGAVLQRGEVTLAPIPPEPAATGQTQAKPRTAAKAKWQHAISRRRNQKRSKRRKKNAPSIVNHQPCTINHFEVELPHA